jgi:hypothetical protein
MNDNVVDARMYFVKDMGDGTGTFVRVDKPLVN